MIWLRYGYTGSLCETSPDFSIDHMCENGAACVSGARDYTCQCPAGTSGIFCGQIAGAMKWTRKLFCIYVLENHLSSQSLWIFNITTTFNNDSKSSAKPVCEIDWLILNVPADGGWSDWNGWGECSQSCDGGTQTRTRACTSPPPDPEGAPCLGEVNQTQACNIETCPGRQYILYNIILWTNKWR